MDKTQEDKLRSRVKKLESALREIAVHAAHGVNHGVPQLVIKSLRDKARAALSRKPTSPAPKS
jgi:hypothetical protein